MKPLYLTLALLILFWNCADTIAQQNVNETKWERFLLRSTKIDGEFRYYSSSSELDEVDPYEGGFGKYSVINVLDKDPTTAWVEGVSGYGIGESIIIGIGDTLPDIISLRNGYQKSESIYRSNSRPKSIRFSLYLGIFLEGDVTEIESGCYARVQTSVLIEELGDKMGDIELDLGWPTKTEEQYIQEFKMLFSDKIEELSEWNPKCLENMKLRYILKLDILDVYKGSKWDDTCISDIWVSYKESTKVGIPTEDIIEDIYESDDMNSGVIFVDTNKERQLILVDKKSLPEYKNLKKGESLDLVLMDISKDKEWAQVNYMFNQEGAGKVEEYSVLYHSRSLSRVRSDILREIYGAYGFTIRDGVNYLDTPDGQIDLNKIQSIINEN